MNPNDGSGERKEVPLDEEAICTATYEPNNDLDKDFGEESGSSDDYIEQVKKKLGDEGGSKNKESQWIPECYSAASLML